METIRTFIAIPIAVEENLADAWDDLRNRFDNRQVKWVSPDILHLTLFFLGETQPKQVNQIQQELAKQINGFNPFNVVLKGMGYFGSAQAPKVVWVGVDKNEELEKLHKATNAVISKLGFTPDERGFNPHITLGRPKNMANYSDLTNLLKSYNQTIFQTSTASEIAHYKSELTPSGAIYSKLYKVELRKSI